MGGGTPPPNHDRVNIMHLVHVLSALPYLLFIFLSLDSFEVPGIVLQDKNKNTKLKKDVQILNESLDEVKENFSFSNETITL